MDLDQAERIICGTLNGEKRHVIKSGPTGLFPIPRVCLVCTSQPTSDQVRILGEMGLSVDSVRQLGGQIPGWEVSVSIRGDIKCPA